MLFFLASAHCLETEPCRGSLNSLCGAPLTLWAPQASCSAPTTFCLGLSLEHPGLGSPCSPSPLSLRIVCPVFLNPHPSSQTELVLSGPLAFVSLDLLRLLASDPGFSFLRQRCFVRPQCPETGFLSSPSGAASWMPHTCSLYSETSPSSCCQERDFPVILGLCSPAGSELPCWNLILHPENLDRQPPGPITDLIGRFRFLNVLPPGLDSGRCLLHTQLRPLTLSHPSSLGLHPLKPPLESRPVRSGWPAGPHLRQPAGSPAHLPPGVPSPPQGKRREETLQPPLSSPRPPGEHPGTRPQLQRADQGAFEHRGSRERQVQGQGAGALGIAQGSGHG